MIIKFEQQILDNMVKDPRNWKGMFYCNKRDPRLMVRKFDSLRVWTFNFASPYSFIALGAIIFITIVSIFLAG